MDEVIRQILLKKAGALLARRSYSRGEMRDKLTTLSDGSPVEPVLERLEQLNLLNDAEYAYNFALCRMTQEGWSPAKVQNSLLRRQVDQAVIEEVLEKIQSEPGHESDLKRFVQKHCRKRGVPANSRELQKLISYLRQRGYEEDRILEAVRQMVPPPIWQRFETGE